MPEATAACPGNRGSDGLQLLRPAWGFSLKVVADFVIALVLLVLAAPIILLTLILIKLTSPGPAIYSQTRLGRNGRHYRIYKVRTMVHNCENVTGPRWSTPGDSRITPVGRFLRRTHLDELPQLINVLKCEMSLVGPRPERPEFAVHLRDAVPYYQQRLVVRPGVTGLAQVQLPGDTDLDSVRRKLAYDLYYVQHLSPWLDFKIILSTGLKVLGVPFRRIRRCFRLPSPQQIQDDYNRLPIPGPKAQFADLDSSSSVQLPAPLPVATELV